MSNLTITTNNVHVARKMEEERQATASSSIFNGFYAKAKQRVLNKIGRRTTLTRNPRVDFASKRIEAIKCKKASIAVLANNAKNQLDNARQAMMDFDRAMLELYKDELGDRKWNDDLGTYTRVLHPEEKVMVDDMERVMKRCLETMGGVLGAYNEHLEDAIHCPNTLDEQAKLVIAMETKEEYKEVRQCYSDLMIDADAVQASGQELSKLSKEKLIETKERYDAMSKRLCEDMLAYETAYRATLAQRISAHFTAEQQLLRGAAAAMKDLYPYTRGLALDWQDMAEQRKIHLEEAKSGSFNELDVTGVQATPMPAQPANTPAPIHLIHPTGSLALDSFQVQAASVATAAAANIGMLSNMAALNAQSLMKQYGPGATTAPTNPELYNIKI